MLSNQVFGAFFILQEFFIAYLLVLGLGKSLNLLTKLIKVTVEIGLVLTASRNMIVKDFFMMTMQLITFF